MEAKLKVERHLMVFLFIEFKMLSGGVEVQNPYAAE